jgi:hypothetical protein
LLPHGDFCVRCASALLGFHTAEVHGSSPCVTIKCHNDLRRSML